MEPIDGAVRPSSMPATFSPTPEVTMIRTRYAVTKSHTAGLLAGSVTTEITSCDFPIGFVVKKAIGGGAYVITNCVPVR
jgi:hypothetical protein